MPQHEETLALIKPMVVERGLDGKIYQTYLRSGLTIATIRVIYPDTKFWMEFYAEHARKSFFMELIQFMHSGPAIAFRMRGWDAVRKIRTLNGATDPREADPRSIRGRWGKDLSFPDNLVHGSTDDDAARRELNLVFGPNSKWELVL